MSATPEQSQLLIDLYAAGMSMRNIRRRIGISEDRIRAILVAAGVTIRKDASAEGARERDLRKMKSSTVESERNTTFVSKRDGRAFSSALPDKKRSS